MQAHLDIWTGKVKRVFQIIELPNGKYQVIYADPPWSYDCKEPTASKGGAKGSGYSGGVNYYYATMSTKEIMDMPIKNISADDCVLFLWATNPLLPEAMETMTRWGFKYKTTLTWHKLRCKGMGYWFRGHTEFLLFGVMGHVKAFRSLEHNIKTLPVEQHSKKPHDFRILIDAVTVNMQPKIELFARERHVGWDTWGNEVPKETQMLLAMNDGRESG